MRAAIRGTCCCSPRTHSIAVARVDRHDLHRDVRAQGPSASRRLAVDKAGHPTPSTAGEPRDQLARVGLHAADLAGDEEDEVERDVDHVGAGRAPARAYTRSSCSATSSQVGMAGASRTVASRQLGQRCRQGRLAVDDPDISGIAGRQLAVRGQRRRHDRSPLRERLEYSEALPLRRAHVDERSGAADHLAHEPVVVDLAEPDSSSPLEVGLEAPPFLRRSLEATEHDRCRAARGRERGHGLVLALAAADGADHHHVLVRKALRGGGADHGVDPVRHYDDRLGAAADQPPQQARLVVRERDDDVGAPCSSRRCQGPNSGIGR